MKRIPVLIFILVALAQLAVPAMLAWGRIQTLTHGRVWKFKTAPVDPEEGVIFPFNRFWVTEKDAPAAEKAYRENSQRTKQNAYMTVRVRNGDAALEQLYIDNQPLADYLRAQTAEK